jgi:L-aspartate semialdehyde sulfurtransferase ferredoxin
MAIARKIVLRFPARLVESPIVYRLVRDYNLSFNILQAMVTPYQEGLLVLELNGASADYEAGIRYLTEAGIAVQSLQQNILRDDDKCTQCGSCITVCPVNAFTTDKATLYVNFQDDRCIACGLCIKTCPPHAMRMSLEKAL